MKKNQRDAIIDSPHFSYLLIRDYLLTNLLGNEAQEILYWSGKELARQFPLSQYDDLTEAFAHCGFGRLTLLKNHVYLLTGELVTTRLLNKQVNFHLEAGFLSEQLSHIHEQPVEVQIKQQSDAVEFTAIFL